MTVSGRFFMGVVVAAMAAGCSQKLTYERWATIQPGDSEEVVAATLGEPADKPSDMTWLYLDPDRNITAYIYFDDAQVIGKTWADPERGMIGQSPKVNQPGDMERQTYQKIE